MEGELLIRDLLILPSLVLPILYLIGFTKHGRAYKVFTAYLTFIAILQCILVVYALYKENNHFLFTYYFIGQFLFMSLFYYFLLKKKWIWWVMVIVLIALGFQYILAPASFINFNSFGVSITQSIIVLYALLYYYKCLSEKAIFLLLNTGILFYFLTSILFFASGNLMLDLNLPQQTLLQFEYINDFLYLTFMLLIFLEWYRNYRPKKHKKTT